MEPAEVIAPRCRPASAGPERVGRDRPLTRINQINKLDGMEPQQIGAFEAKTRLSELLEQVSRGRRFVITRRGRAVAELRPVAATARLRFGCDRGAIVVRDDFDAPLPEMKPYTA